MRPPAHTLSALRGFSFHPRLIHYPTKPQLRPLVAHSLTLTPTRLVRPVSTGNTASSVVETNSLTMPEHGKRPLPERRGGKKFKKRRSKRERTIQGDCTKEDILKLDIFNLAKHLGIEQIAPPPPPREPRPPRPAPDSELPAVPQEEDMQNAISRGEEPKDHDQQEKPKGDPDAYFPEFGTEITVEVKGFASTGEGLAIPVRTAKTEDTEMTDEEKNATSSISGPIYVVNFAVPGDIALVKVFRHHEDHSVADLLSVTTPSPERDDSLIKCKYFSTCGGCNFQMIPYDTQLAHKREVVKKAFINFSNLPPEELPECEDTLASPQQYGYRTKLTPHFDGPPQNRFKRGDKSLLKPLESVPNIGYTQVGRRHVVVDIEDCPIGTDVLRQGMASQRSRMKTEFGKYTHGSTILLRESTNRVFKKPDGSLQRSPPRPPTPQSFDIAPTDKEQAAAPFVVNETDRYIDYKTCVTDNKADCYEYVGEDKIFKNPAGSFFQNNNHILPQVVKYIHDRIEGPKPIKNLIDAYCGTGLFTITLASLFQKKEGGEDGEKSDKSGGKAIGIDVAGDAIAYARENARLNGIPKDACSFIAADASKLFDQVSKLNPDETAVILDPPRKGCDANFLAQLMEYAPRRIVYMSCNVHTQARDIGMLVRGAIDALGTADTGDCRDDKPKYFKKASEEKRFDQVGERLRNRRARYKIESIRGFDFFPQTAHVEGVAVLQRDEEAWAGTKEVRQFDDSFTELFEAADGLEKSDGLGGGAFGEAFEEEKGNTGF